MDTFKVELLTLRQRQRLPKSGPCLSYHGYQAVKMGYSVTNQSLDTHGTFHCFFHLKLPLPVCVSAYVCVCVHQCWEFGIPLCRELAFQYESLYDYQSLSWIRVSCTSNTHRTVDPLTRRTICSNVTVCVCV